MQKRHFEAIATALKAQKPADHWDANKRVQWALDVKAVAQAISAFNPLFRMGQFMRACGIEEAV